MDERTNNRYVVDKHVECFVGERKYTLFMYDLSVGGCMLEDANGLIAGGESPSLNLSNFVEVTGKVVWTGGGCIGVRFDHMLHEAVVKHLGFVPSPLAFERMEARDRFGRQLPAQYWA